MHELVHAESAMDAKVAAVAMLDVALLTAAGAGAAPDAGLAGCTITGTSRSETLLGTAGRTSSAASAGMTTSRASAATTSCSVGVATT